MGGEFPPGGNSHPLPQFSTLEGGISPPPSWIDHYRGGEIPPLPKKIERDIARRDHFSFQKGGDFLLNLPLLESEGGVKPKCKIHEIDFLQYWGRLFWETNAKKWNFERVDRILTFSLASSPTISFLTEVWEVWHLNRSLENISEKWQYGEILISRCGWKKPMLLVSVRNCWN